MTKPRSTRSKFRNMLSRAWAALKRVCSTRKGSREPECRTVRSGNKNLTINVRNRNKMPLLSRLASRERSTPAYQRALANVRKNNAPSPLRLPAISPNAFFRPSRPRSATRRSPLRGFNNPLGSPRAATRPSGRPPLHPGTHSRSVSTRNPLGSPRRGVTRRRVNLSHYRAF